MARPSEGSFIPKALKWAFVGMLAFPFWLDLQNGRGLEALGSGCLLLAALTVVGSRPPRHPRVLIAVWALVGLGVVGLLLGALFG